MKRLKIITIIALILLVLPIRIFGQPSEKQVQEMQEKINEGRSLKSKYDEAKEKSLEAARNAIKNINDDNLFNKFVEARGRRLEAAQKLIENRNEVINDVIDKFGLTVPAGQKISYDIDCKGECVHGYCSVKCPIGLCEKAFNPQPWGGGGTPGWIATIIKHELEHKNQINPGPPPSWKPEYNGHDKGDDARAEYEAWQAALKCAQKTGITLAEQLKILEMKLYWLGEMIASLEARLKALVEWDTKREAALPGSTIHKSIVLTNYSDVPQIVNCTFRDSLKWEIFPNMLTALLNPGQDTSFEVTIFVPHMAELGTKNEIFCDAKSNESTVTDFTFIFVEPLFNVTAGSDTSGLRDSSVPFNFTVKSNINAAPDSFRVQLTNPLGWTIEPSFYDVVLMPGEQINLSGVLTIPESVPFWTTNLVFCNTISKTEPVQIVRGWLSVAVSEVDVSPLIVESPLGNKQYGSTVTPGVWIYNSGKLDGVFDIFFAMDINPPYLATKFNLNLSAGHDTLIEFSPVILKDTGNISLKFYIIANGDANPSNDTITSTFYVQPLPPPVISQLEPNSGEQGDTIKLTISGENFVDGATIGFVPPAGIRVLNGLYKNPQELEANINIALDASIELKDLVVTNPDGQSDTLFNAFTVTELKLPEKVVLIAPPNSSIINSDSAEFRWVDYNGDTLRYWFEISTNEQFSGSFIDSTITDTSIVYKPLTNNQSYWWHVKAKNIAGWGPFSDTWNFSVSISNVDEDNNILLKQIRITPNPINEIVEIFYILNNPAYINLSISNIYGQTIKTIIYNELMESGINKTKFDASGLPSGIYFCTLKADNQIETVKMIVIK